jgi:hypothetical protein
LSSVLTSKDHAASVRSHCGPQDLSGSAFFKHYILIITWLYWLSVCLIFQSHLNHFHPFSQKQ